MPSYHQYEQPIGQAESVSTTSQLEGPADYLPQMTPLDTHGRLNSHAQRQQRYPAHRCLREQAPQQHQPNPQREQYPQNQAMPTYQVNVEVAPQSHSRQHKPAAGNATTTLLPYCTADTPLNDSQVIAVTDVAGNLQELALLALGAKAGDEDCMLRLGNVLGSGQALAGVVDFFSGEFGVE